MRKRLTYATAALVLTGALAGGGAAVATSGDDHAIGGPNAKRARAAAESFVRGGHAGSVELDGEHGATYDVEVHRGHVVVDVWLDASFNAIASEPDSDARAGDTGD
jgi:hypothetical protein